MYPHEALADDERRYLRRQKPVEVRRKRFSRGGWAGVRRWTWIAVSASAAIWGGYQGARFLLFSPVVTLRDYGQIEIAGNRYVSRDAVTEKFASDLGRSILRTPLEERRAALESIPWVAQAVVERVLPDRIRVELVERVPVAFLRTPSGLALVDAQGVILDRPLESEFHFPVVSGISETMPAGEREKRMRLYMEFMKEIELARPGASDSVSEVDLSQGDDVQVTLTAVTALESQDTLLVRFGDGDFVNKYRLLMENAEQWHERTGRIESVDLRFSRQVIVNPEQTASSRP